MTKKIILTGSIFAAIAIILGAFGAHALKTLISPEQLVSYETGVRYQFYHAIAILVLAGFSDKLNPNYLAYSFNAFVFGIALFSGSLYLLSLRTLLGIENYKWLGPITPLGGLSFIIAWLLLFVSVLKKRD
jgi:uncharacterized membrane protein YgdD (TMEM256/DUF423 family)